jgi:hypothetical protein
LGFVDTILSNKVGGLNAIQKSFGWNILARGAFVIRICHSLSSGVEQGQNCTKKACEHTFLPYFIKKI